MNAVQAGRPGPAVRGTATVDARGLLVPLLVTLDPEVVLIGGGVDRVARAQLLASADVITELSNRKRDALVNLEQRSRKDIVVDIDLAAGPDTVRLVCFDTSGNKVDLEKLAKLKKPNFVKADEITLEDVKEFERTQPTLLSEPDDADEDEGKSKDKSDSSAADTQAEPAKDESDDSAEGGKKKRRRRRRRRRKSSGEGEAENTTPSDNQPEASADDAQASGYEGASVGPPTEGDEPGPSDATSSTETDGEQPVKKKRRRRRRGGRRHRKNKNNDGESSGQTDEAAGGESSEQSAPEPAVESAPPADPPAEAPEPAEPAAEDEPKTQPKKKTRRRRRKKSDDASAADAGAEPDADKSGSESKAEPESTPATESES